MSRESALAQIKSVPFSVPRDQIRRSVLEFLASYPASDEADAVRRADLFSDDATLEDPVGGPAVRSRDALIEFFKVPIEYGVVIRMKSKQIILSGDEAISLTDASWGREGTKPASVHIVHNFAFDAEGKITNVRIFFDEGCVDDD